MLAIVDALKRSASRPASGEASASRVARPRASVQPLRPTNRARFAVQRRAERDRIMNHVARAMRMPLRASCAEIATSTSGWRMQLEQKNWRARSRRGEPADDEVRCPAVIGGEGKTQQKCGITDQQGQGATEIEGFAAALAWAAKDFYHRHRHGRPMMPFIQKIHGQPPTCRSKTADGRTRHPGRRRSPKRTDQELGRAAWRRSSPLESPSTSARPSQAGQP